MAFAVSPHSNGILLLIFSSMRCDGPFGKRPPGNCWLMSDHFARTPATHRAGCLVAINKQPLEASWRIAMSLAVASCLGCAGACCMSAEPHPNKPLLMNHDAVCYNGNTTMLKYQIAGQLVPCRVFARGPHAARHADSPNSAINVTPPAKICMCPPTFQNCTPKLFTRRCPPLLSR